MTTNQIFVYDFTMAEPCAPIDYIEHGEEIARNLRMLGKKWGFQLERGETGYVHWQGRISLIKKKRQHEAVKLLQRIECLKGIHLSPTTESIANNPDDFYDYVDKFDTRVDSVPQYFNTDEVKYIPRQVREIKELYPWQQYIIDHANVWDTRTINVVLDQRGNSGKSTLVTYMRAHKLARKIPFCNDYIGVMRMVCNLPTSNCYLFDFPRAINKERLYQLFGAIEEVKSGYAYDDRYHFKEKIFDCPNIWLFTNVMPELDMLSIDRWRFWSIDEEMELIERDAEDFLTDNEDDPLEP